MNDEIEGFIRQAFEENFEQLRAESGHSLSPDVKEAAFQEVLLYWRKLHDLAEKITDTEVRLNLPNQSTPKGRKFGIEGVVDIVREAERTTMYDLKTHDADFIRENRQLYEDQLNIYAHVWCKLRGQPLDETAVISTHVPPSVKDAIASGEAPRLACAMEQWEPVIPIPFDPDNVEATIRDLGAIVDKIEDGEFSASPMARLKQREYGRRTFGERVCGNCDVRYSCQSYREYAGSPRRRDSAQFATYFDPLADDAQREAWRDATAAGPGPIEEPLEDV